MNSRARWILAAVSIVVVVGIAVSMVVAGEREPRTWIVQPGETLKVSILETYPDDLWRCPGKGGVNGTPDPGHGVGASGGFSIETSPDGTVTAYCEPGPPADY